MKGYPSIFLLTLIILVSGQLHIVFCLGEATISGVIVDAVTSRPIPMAEISIGTGKQWFESNLGSVTADTEGRYSIRVRESAQYHFIVRSREVGREQYRFYDHCWSRKTIVYSPTIQLDFALEPAGSIIVKMFGSDGRRLGYRSKEKSWIRSVSLTSIYGAGMGNRTEAHTSQPYRSDDEELLLLSPEGIKTIVLCEITVPSLGKLTTAIDNGGDGFSLHSGDLLVLNINHEIAETTYREFSAWSAKQTNASTTLRRSVDGILEHVSESRIYEQKGDDMMCASESNTVISSVLQLRNEMWLTIPFSMEHPRLYFTSSEIQAIKDKTKDGFSQQLWKSLLADSDRYLSLPPPQLSPSGTTRWTDWSATANSAIMRIEHLALAYTITGDAKYAAKAKEIMWAVLSWPSWIDPTEEGEPGLMMGSTTAGIAIGYDWLYHYLNTEERDFVVRTVAEKGAEPLYRASVGGIWWCDRSRCNWNAITHGGMGLAGLAFLGEHADAPKWIGLTASKMWKYFDSGGRNGGWGEGLTYWRFGLAQGLLFTDALRKVTSIDLYPSAFLGETLYFPIYLMAPGLERHVNFGDSWLGSDDVSWIATLTMRLSSEYRNGHGQMLVSSLTDRYEVKGDARTWALIWYDKSVTPRQLDDLPLSRLFEGLGWVITRSGWESNDLLLAFKSGPNWNHGHADQNQFILEAFGEPLLVDLGAGVYSTQYWEASLDYHMASVGHNVVLVNGQGQVDPRPGWSSMTPSGEILAFQTYSGRESYYYMTGDASGTYPMPLTFIRQILFVPPSTVLVLDTVEASKPSKFQWLAHTTGEFKSDGNEFKVAKGKALLTMKVLLPNRFDWKTYSDQKRTIEWSKDEPAQRLELSTQEESMSVTFLTVLYPTKSGETTPRISLAENRTTWVVTIEDESVHHVCLDRTKRPPTFLTSRSRALSLLDTTRRWLERIEAKKFGDPEALALVQSAKIKFQEAVQASQSGDWERSSTKAAESITEFERAFAIEARQTQNLQELVVIAIGVSIFLLVTLAFVFSRRRKPSPR